MADPKITHSRKCKGRKSKYYCSIFSYFVKDQIFRNKKKLKGSKLVICEDLTRKRQSIISALSQLRYQKKIHSFWTVNGTIKLKHNEASTTPAKLDIWKFRNGKTNVLNDLTDFISTL